MAKVAMNRDGKVADVDESEVKNWEFIGWSLGGLSADEVQDEPSLFDVYMMFGENKAAKPARASLSISDAESFVANNSSNAYVIEPAE